MVGLVGGSCRARTLSPSAPTCSTSISNVRLYGRHRHVAILAVTVQAGTCYEVNGPSAERTALAALAICGTEALHAAARRRRA